MFFPLRFSDTLAFSIKMLDIKLCLVTDILVRREEPKSWQHVNGEQCPLISLDMLFLEIHVINRIYSTST